MSRITDRIVYAAMLLGSGMTTAEAAAHPLVASTPAAIKMALRRRGVSVSAIDTGALRLPADGAAFEEAGAARKTSAAKVAAKALAILGADKALLDNVLDDGVR